MKISKGDAPEAQKPDESKSDLEENIENNIDDAQTQITMKPFDYSPVNPEKRDRYLSLKAKNKEGAKKIVEKIKLMPFWKKLNALEEIEEKADARTILVNKMNAKSDNWLSKWTELISPDKSTPLDLGMVEKLVNLVMYHDIKTEISHKEYGERYNLFSSSNKNFVTDNVKIFMAFYQGLCYTGATKSSSHLIKFNEKTDKPDKIKAAADYVRSKGYELVHELIVKRAEALAQKEVESKNYEHAIEFLDALGLKIQDYKGLQDIMEGHLDSLYEAGKTDEALAIATKYGLRESEESSEMYDLLGFITDAEESSSDDFNLNEKNNKTQ